MSVAVTSHSSEVEDVHLSVFAVPQPKDALRLPAAAPQLPRGEYVQVGKLPSWKKEIEGHRRRNVDEEDGRKGWSVSAEEA